VVLVVVVEYIWDTYLDLRQHFKYREKMPSLLMGIVDKLKFEEAQEYGYDKSVFHLVHSAFNQLLNMCILFFGVLPLLWELAGNILSIFDFSHDYEILQSLIFLFLYYVISTFISLPWSIYSTFVIEERHGFNKQTVPLFVVDFVKSIGLSVAFGGPILAGLIKFMQWGGEQLYIWVFLFLLVVQILMIYIYPVVIQPCFNTFTPLEDGSLKTRIEDLATSLNFPLTKIYVIDGSARSSHSNAYFYGFWNNKRIVLYDTLFEQVDEDEIVAILGHELGHWKSNHLFKRLFWSEVHIFTLLYIFSHFISEKAMYRSFGFGSEPTIIGFILFQFLYSPIETVLTFLMHLLSRSHEFEADRFAVDLKFGGGLKSGLTKLQIENLSNMNPDKLYSTYHYSHPPLLERLEAIDIHQKKK